MLLAVGLVVPRTSGVSAVGLVVIALLGLVLYTAYAGFPGLLWAVIPAALAAFSRTNGCADALIRRHADPTRTIEA